MKKLPFVIAFLASAGVTQAEQNANSDHGLVEPHFEEGSISTEEGLAAWERIFGVTQHPRCANCHTDEANVPMWSGPSFGQKAQPHGMNVNAGESRIGAEFLPCRTCHATSARPNLEPHAAPHAGIDWQLAPVEFVWFGVSESALCNQLRDPERNGGRDGAGLVEHILHDVSLHGFIAWGFDPGGDREAAPGSLQEHLDDMALWAASGLPCPGD